MPAYFFIGGKIMIPYSKGDIINVNNTLGNFWAEVVKDVSDKEKIVPVKLEIPEENINSILNISRDSVRTLREYVDDYVSAYEDVFNLTSKDITDDDIEELQTTINGNRNPQTSVIEMLIDIKNQKEEEQER